MWNFKKTFELLETVDINYVEELTPNIWTDRDLEEEDTEYVSDKKDALSFELFFVELEGLRTLLSIVIFILSPIIDIWEKGKTHLTCIQKKIIN